MTAAHGNAYSYDANGNQTARTIGGVTYAMTFDAENWLTAVAGGSTSASFIYAADGSRTVGTVDGVTTVYIGGVYEWQAGASTAYYAGPDGPVAFRRNGYATGNGVYYLLRNHLGSSGVIVDGSGHAVKQAFCHPLDDSSRLTCTGRESRVPLRPDPLERRNTSVLIPDR